VSFAISIQHQDPSVNAIVESLEDNKAEDISVISLKGKAEFAEFMVVASGRSNKHVDSVSEKVFRDLKTKKMYCTKPEGRPLCDWTVIDAGHVLVHIFRNEIREVYDLEKLWSEDFSTVNSAS
jgi:ribosome-associated protein|tara:strand:- start:44 stop:412 length:369 start_codon:yes stop_codon:yes gene_type:complete